MEHVAALQHDGRHGGERVSEADHAHVVTVLPQPSLLVATLETENENEMQVLKVLTNEKTVKILSYSIDA